MIIDIEWRAWPPQQIVDVFPGLLDEVESQLQIFSAEYRDKNRLVIDGFRATPLTIYDIQTGQRNKDVAAIGFALDALGRQAKVLNFEDNLRLFQAAHEIFRAGNRLSQPAKPQQQTLGNALRVIVNHGVELMVSGEGDVGVLREDIERFVVSAWGSFPDTFALTVNEMLLTELERARSSHENEKAFHERFVRDNIEAVLALEIPTRMEKVVDRWLEIGEHVAPTAVRMAQRNFRRPDKLSDLLSIDVWNRIEHALERGEADELGRALADVEEALETNLRLRLNARIDYREPVSELRYQGTVDRYFKEAHQLLIQRDPLALEKFKDLHRHRSNHTVAKEWYAYALSQFGRSTDIHDIIELLEDTIQSDFFRPDMGWVARWNLACALRRLPNRADESLDVLLPVLDNDFHISDAFELCVLWALEQDRDKELDTLLLKSPHHEAHLLIALRDTQHYTQKDDPQRFQYHFRRINRILRDRDRTFFDPNERLSEKELIDLTRGFVDNSLVAAGVEWFRQRLANDRERGFYKNWECAAELNEAAEDLAAAWRCREQQWYCTQNNRSLEPAKKTLALRFALSWAERNDFAENGLRLLRQSWRRTSMSDADVQYWERKLGGAPAPPPPSPPPPPQRPQVQPPESPQTDEPPLVQSLDAAEAIVQSVAGTFRSVGTADMLASRGADAERLIAATRFKHRDIPAELIDAVQEIVRLSAVFHRGVDEENSQQIAAQMRSQIEQLRKCRGQVPFELNGLVEACERVSQNLAVRVRAVPEPNTTPPADLKIAFDTPAPGDSYVTRIGMRLTNPAAEDMRNIAVSFVSTSSHVQPITDSAPISLLPTQTSCIAECAVQVTDGVEESVEIRAFISFETGGVKRSIQSAGRVPVRPVGEPIPTTVRYVTDKPVGSDRKDVFHGRDRELKDLAAAFAGGEMRRLYFVNGIRRVGKSSLINHLGSRFGTDVLPIVINVEQALEGTQMTAVKFVRQLIRRCIEELEAMKGLPPVSLALPAAADFELDPPWTVFDDFLRKVRQQTGRRSILLCFDEMQRLVMRIADSNDPMDEGFLSWLRGKIQGNSSVLVVGTGSEPYDIMRDRFKQHTIWGNMEPYNVSFVDQVAMKKIATLPVESDNVTWLSESLDRLWNMTEGHPWVIQILAEKVCEHLNLERRRVVMPSDVDAAADEVLLTDSRISELWWNESDGLVTKDHRQIAFLILQHQEAGRRGILEETLGEICQRAGLRKVGTHLDEMKALELLSSTMDGNALRWRIRSIFLEKYLTILRQREVSLGSQPPGPSQEQPLALMLDWENVKIGLSKCLDKMPVAKAQELRPRLDTLELAKRLHESATRHGKPRQRWAVANWDNSYFVGDQASLKKQIRYETDMSGADKANASDHVLRERIHEVLREHSEIGVYVIGTGDGDFMEAIRTLQMQGKRVVLWSTKDSMNPEYRNLLVGPDPILIEWLEDLVFGVDQGT